MNTPLTVERLADVIKNKVCIYTSCTSDKPCSECGNSGQHGKNPDLCIRYAGDIRKAPLYLAKYDIYRIIKSGEYIGLRFD